TADAVKQVVDHLDRHDFDFVMILSGDQLYQMDFSSILEFHKEQGADVTVATIPVVAKDAPGFGILKANAGGEILSFVEKPPFEELVNWTSDVEPHYADQDKHYLASMGIYVFTKGILSKLFEEKPEATDFGKEFIPYMVNEDKYKTFSFPFGGYWSDIGTVASFFESNLMLTESLPDFNLYDNENRLYTNTRMLSPSKFSNTQLEQALIADGCIIHADRIFHSVIGIRSRIGNGTTIEDAIVMGNDYYQTVQELTKKPESELLGIGENCYIKNTIIDKNARIGSNCRIIGSPELADFENDEYCIRDGIIIIKKGKYIDSGTHIGA
ncbi:MAG: sugar phosphate nucleotidyltransferase, partial [Bacteroidota bacterium]